MKIIRVIIDTYNTYTFSYLRKSRKFDSVNVGNSRINSKENLYFLLEHNRIALLEYNIKWNRKKKRDNELFFVQLFCLL